MGSSRLMKNIAVRISLVSLLILIFFTISAESQFRHLEKTKNIVYMTAIECIDLDKAFATFSVCSLKPINRTLKLLSIRVILHQEPVTKSTINFRVLKKANGYKPFGIDVKLDICKYFAGKKNPAFNWFYNIWLPYTNINHTCPYYSDMIVDQVPIINIPLPSVFPDGMYRLDFEVSAYNIPRALVKLYLNINEIKLRA